MKPAPSEIADNVARVTVCRLVAPGVERLAEEVLWWFPEARFAVLSSDTVGTPKAAQNFIESVQAGDVDIIYWHTNGRQRPSFSKFDPCWCG